MSRNGSLSPDCFAGLAGDGTRGQAKGTSQALKSLTRQISNAARDFSLETKLFGFSSMGRIACFPSTWFLELTELFSPRYTLVLTIKRTQINMRRKHCRKFQPTKLSFATQSREVMADDLRGYMALLKLLKIITTDFTVYIGFYFFFD